MCEMQQWKSWCSGKFGCRNIANKDVVVQMHSWEASAVQNRIRVVLVNSPMKVSICSGAHVVATIVVVSEILWARLCLRCMLGNVGIPCAIWIMSLHTMSGAGEGMLKTAAYCNDG